MVIRVKVVQIFCNDSYYLTSERKHLSYLGEIVKKNNVTQCPKKTLIKSKF